MAGIGFKLQKLLLEEIYLSAFKGFFYALVITSGPWLIMIISLAILSIYFSYILNPKDHLLFNLLLVHISVLTVITTGTFQLYFTRIFSDNVYSKKRDELPNVIITNLIVTMAVLMILVTPFIYSETLFPQYVTFAVKMLSFCLLFALNIIWVLMNYVSASDVFIIFVSHYIIGSMITIVLGGLLGYFSEFSGFFFGFFIGQAYIASVLFYLTIKVFGLPSKLYISAIHGYSNYRILIVSGFFMYMGMWIDKFIYWYGPSGQHLTPVLYYHPVYNEIFFAAFLLMTPVMAIFFIAVETTFYKSYYTYHEKHVYTETLEQLIKSSYAVKNTVKKSLMYIIRIQGLIVILGILFSKNILTLLNMPPNQYILFNVILIGVFFHMLILITCILLFYLDLKIETMIIYVLFFCLNGSLTLTFMHIGGGYSGFGYMISSVVVCVYSLWKLNGSLDNLNYLTYTRQKIPEHENAEDVFIMSTGCYGRYYMRNRKKILSN